MPDGRSSNSRDGGYHGPSVDMGKHATTSGQVDEGNLGENQQDNYTYHHIPDEDRPRYDDIQRHNRDTDLKKDATDLGEDLDKRDTPSIPSSQYMAVPHPELKRRID